MPLATLKISGKNLKNLSLEKEACDTEMNPWTAVTIHGRVTVKAHKVVSDLCGFENCRGVKIFQMKLCLR